MNQLILPLLFLSLTSINSATTIVILRTTKEIVVAADSKRMRIGNASIRVACKIYCLKNRCFAMSGNTFIVSENRVLLDGHQLGKEALRKVGSLKEALSIFEKGFLEVFPAAAKKIVRDQREYYQNEMDKKITLSVIFFGLEGSERQIVGTQFRIQGYRENKGIITPESISFEVPRDMHDLPVNILGQQDAIIRLGKARPDYFYNYDLVTTARMMIELEIADSPDKVGLPVDIVQVAQNGVRWIARKSECE